jgi:TfoX/Sxy family transcriptional regulator of competence genes
MSYLPVESFIVQRRQEGGWRVIYRVHDAIRPLCAGTTLAQRRSTIPACDRDACLKTTGADRRTKDGCQRRLCRIPSRAARPARPRHDATHVRQDRRVLRRLYAGDGERQHAVLPDDNRATFKEAECFPPLNYEKKGGTIDLAFWRAPERLFDEPDELVTWAREALAAARRVAAKREHAAQKQKSRRQPT